MAPEQVFGRADKTADVFSLGAILCEILAGEKLTGEDHAVAAQLDRCQCDQELADLAKHCLRKSPADRPQHAGIVAERVSAHLNAIQARLQDARIAAARAELEAKEERRRRQRTVWQIAVVTIFLVVAGLCGLLVRRAVIERQEATRANGLVDQLLAADIERVPLILESLEACKWRVVGRLGTQFDHSKAGSAERLHLALALPRGDDRKVECLRDHLLRATPIEFPVVRAALTPQKDRMTDSLWQLAGDEDRDAAKRFRALAALAEYGPADERWNSLAPFVAAHLTGSIPSAYLGQWLQHMRRVRYQLTGPLAVVLADRGRSARQREAAALALADYLRNEPEKLVDIMLSADEVAEFTPLLAALRPQRAAVEQQLITELRAPMPDQPSTSQRDEHWKRQSISAVTLVQLGYGGEVWPLLLSSPDPSLRSFIIHHLGKLETDPKMLASRLAVEPEVSIRRALIQSLGSLDLLRIRSAERSRITEQVQQLYTNDPDPGLHSSASWALRKWGITLPPLASGAPVVTVEKALLSELQKVRRWYVNSEGQTMVVIAHALNSAEIDIDDDFAIASHEVTVAEFLRFRPAHEVSRLVAATDDCPVHNVSWHMAAAYCNWLSAQDGIPQNEWVYVPKSNSHNNEMISKENYLELRGYRLPTAAQWQHACRAGTTGTYSFGEPLALLPHYAHFASAQSHSVESFLPNAVGLFDMHGNVWECCHAQYSNGRRQQYCGGSYRTARPLPSSSGSVISAPTNFRDSKGFRVARTYRCSSVPAPFEVRVFPDTAVVQQPHGR
jgi:hypothetical protein